MGFFVSQLHNFSHVSQNIYQWHNFCQVCVSLFWPGYQLTESFLSLNIFVGFFLATQGQRFPGAAGFKTQTLRLPAWDAMTTQLRRPLQHWGQEAQGYNINFFQIKNFQRCFSLAFIVIRESL